MEERMVVARGTERRKNFVMAYHELWMCYGHVIGARGIAVWLYLASHRHRIPGGVTGATLEVHESLAGRAWPGMRTMQSALSIGDRRTLTKTIDSLRAVRLLRVKRADSLFTREQLAGFRKAGEKIQDDQNVYIVNDPLEAKEIAAVHFCGFCPACPHRQGCKAISEVFGADCRGEMSTEEFFKKPWGWHHERLGLKVSSDTLV